MGAVLGPLPQEHEVAWPVDIAVMVDDLALDDQKLLMTGVFVRLARTAGCHPIDVEARAIGKGFIELQIGLSLDLAPVGNEWLVCSGVIDIDDQTLVLLDYSHGALALACFL